MGYIKPELRTIKIKCPKCKSKHLSLIEIWRGATISWISYSGTIEHNNGYLDPGNGDPYKVEGHCLDCGKRWTIRGAKLIDDILI